MLFNLLLNGWLPRYISSVAICEFQTYLLYCIFLITLRANFFMTYKIIWKYFRYFVLWHLFAIIINQTYVYNCFIVQMFPHEKYIKTVTSACIKLFSSNPTTSIHFLVAFYIECRFPCIVNLHSNNVVWVAKLWAIVQMRHADDKFIEI